MVVKAVMEMQQISQIGNHAGFTLLELVLAMTLAGMVLTAVYSTFSVSVDTQRRVARVASRTQAWRFFSERLRSDVKNLLVEEQALRGDQNTLTLNLAHAEEVRYEQRDTAESKQVRRIVLTGDGDDESASETVVFEGVEKLSFRYFSDGKWLDKFEQGLPRAVECIVHGAEGEQRMVVSLEVDHAED